MEDAFQVLDTVALTVDLPDVNLRRGQVGTVVDLLAGGQAFEVEFSDRNGRTYALCGLIPSQMMVLRYAPADRRVRGEELSFKTCDVCGRSGAQLRYMTRSYGKGAKLLVIEDVPTVVCPHCGESFLTAETLDEIERIRHHRRSLAKSRKVDVASFTGEAGSHAE